MQLIGEGGTSRIFKAMQQPINRIVALKIPSFAHAGNILTPDEFLSEATLMARLEHGNVVRIYDFGVHEDSAFICMEYVEGWNLLELISARGALPVSAVLAAGMQTLEGLTYAHSKNVLHLDLSPANVIISRSGTAKLSDFGMAGKKFRASEGRIVGTPAFLSPEHAAGKPGTTASDLFSFASLLYFAATGEPLFDPGQGNVRVTQAIREIESARGAPPEGRLKRLPSLLYKPVLTALESRDPERLMRELRDAWKKLEGEERPETVLRRELELDGDPLAPGSQDAAETADDLPAGQELRDRYIRLRESGKHREAVALLEKAMRRHPDNPLLRELLAIPPAKAKSAPVTVDVGAAPIAESTRPAGHVRPGGGSKNDDQSGIKNPSRSISGKPFRAAAGVLGILAVTLAVLAWAGNRDPGAEGKPRPGPVSSVANGESPRPDADPSAQAAKPDAGAASESLTAAAESAARSSGQFTAVALAMGEGSKDRRQAAPIAKPVSPRRPRPPAVSLSGPAGTKVTVDDSLEWISPGPKGGRRLSPGLVNITLTPPGSHRPISSSLFISSDTLYILNLEADGGFSVTRKRR